MSTLYLCFFAVATWFLEAKSTQTTEKVKSKEISSCQAYYEDHKNLLLEMTMKMENGKKPDN